MIKYIGSMGLGFKPILVLHTNQILHSKQSVPDSQCSQCQSMMKENQSIYVDNLSLKIHLYCLYEFKFLVMLLLGFSRNTN